LLGSGPGLRPAPGRLPPWVNMIVFDMRDMIQIITPTREAQSGSSDYTATGRQKRPSMRLGLYSGANYAHDRD